MSNPEADEESVLGDTDAMDGESANGFELATDQKEAEARLARKALGL